jgi:hypothetical protein
MVIVSYYLKKKEIIKKVKAIKVVQRQTQTENTRKSNISVIAPKVTS